MVVRTSNKEFVQTMTHGAIKSDHHAALTRNGEPSMQRLILDALLRREGGDWVFGEDHPDRGFYLQLGVHDLRAVNRELARAHGGISRTDFASPRWQVSFTRAALGLVERRLLEVVPSLQGRRFVRVSSETASAMCGE